MKEFGYDCVHGDNMGFLGSIFKSGEDKAIAKMAKTADEILALESKYSGMTDSELREQTEKLKARFNDGEKLNELLIDAFAVVREASARVLNMRHFKVQLIGGIALHTGKIAEMSTGEGKTLVATLPAYLNALSGKGVHIVTVNDYLARRDAEWMGKIYKFLGLSVGVIVPNMPLTDKRAQYECDIVYATNNELGFDYLRDNMIVNKEDKIQRELNYAIIDEVDSILIDEARTPLIISGESGKASDSYGTANRFAKTLVDDDVVIEAKERSVSLAESGVEKAERFFKLENLGDIENQDINHYINNAVKARFMMSRDVDYVVDGGEVIIVDEHTGRTMPGRRYSDGLHQAIEAKENVKIQNETKTLATITFQNFFRLYTKLSGMTGTAKTEEAEFNAIYNLQVMRIPTNMPLQRRDENDQLYTTIAGKYKAIIADVKETHAKGQPILLGTATVEKSEELSKILSREGVRHNVLNAKNHEKEAEIIAQAGKVGAVTIATNMAGRGTDIMLGGNPEFLAKQKLDNLGYPHYVIAEVTSYAETTDDEIIKARADYKKYYDLFKTDTDKEHNEVVALGGLRIIGSERHESRRIDDQLRGRAGRQGDPGSSVFYLSMEDDLVKKFGGEMMKAVADKFKLDDDIAIDIKAITNQIEKAQMRVENRNFSIRKQVLQYDDIMNYQRKEIYAERNKVLFDKVDIHEQIIKMIRSVAEDILYNNTDASLSLDEWEYDDINNVLEQFVMHDGTNYLDIDKCRGKKYEDIISETVDAVLKAYEDKVEDAKEKGINFSEIEKVVLLKNVDNKWMQHMDDMMELKQGIGLLAYGNRDPIVAYRNEGSDMFDEMNENIVRDTVKVLCKSTVERNIERKQVARETATNEPKQATVKREGDKIGRNDPCPCGSGKKYKNCCGR